MRACAGAGGERSALRSGGDHRLKPTDRVDCAHQVASGLAALHRQGGVHLLLATHNVWMAKVGGRAHYALANPMILSWLGLASSECLMGAHSEYPGGSAALEVTLANQRGPLGKSADVFDFGLLMWQLASGLAVREGYPQKDLQRLTDVRLSCCVLCTSPSHFHPLLVGDATSLRHITWGWIQCTLDQAKRCIVLNFNCMYRPGAQEGT
jgi:hypothetical protein